MTGDAKVSKRKRKMNMVLIKMEGRKRLFECDKILLTICNL